MARRLTIERLLRDDDDDSGQTIRQWHIQREGNFITLQQRQDSDRFLIIRATDVQQLCADMQTICSVPEDKEAGDAE